MLIDADTAAGALLGAAGIPAADVPRRPLGADWFREQPAWLAASTVAHELVTNQALSATEAMEVAEDLLTDHEHLDPAARQLLEVGFIEAMICSSSHEPAEATARLLESAGTQVWRTWHQKRERLEALSEMAVASTQSPSAMDANDDAVRMLCRTTTYRAESGRFVVLADLISADRPSPWPLRHPLMTGLVFAGELLMFLVLSLIL